ncbi:hypothetical protein EDC22_104109 [Tepidamorphus gemmatus]|uniref:Uncharacterized protein n=1 Tax=Tepidamorphus gemmatus TaxID=747076 RepID=A0A4R3MDY9_9HYPH|nr:hypothetical protein [Tepidamorphus gemmatus]TCT11352.1 hypothetical protein EDC22_104109 [Tepidamorphus gemmatus]
MKGLTGKRSRPATVDPQQRLATAQYLATFLPELVRLADAAGMDLVAYLLEMARVEAAAEAGTLPARR